MMSASNGRNMMQWHLETRVATPVLAGSALVATLLVVIATKTALHERVQAEALRAAPASAQAELQVCITRSGFCPLDVAVPDAQPCRCAEPWRGAVTGHAWSLRAILHDPGLLPDRADPDADE
jgi:hypothetical protein